MKNFLALALLLCFGAFPAFSQPAKPSPFKEWKLPEDALFFKEKANGDWYKGPEDQREWIAPAGMSPNVFKVLDMHNTELLMARGGFEPLVASQQEQRVRAAALETLKQAFRGAWIPPAELIVPGRINPAPPRPSHEIAYAAFERAGVRGLVWLSIDREVWLYLEQPLADKTALPQPAEVLRPELAANPNARAAFGARQFTRYRAFLPAGDYQPVQITLIHCQLPQSLAPANFGYAGPVTP